MNFGKVAFDIAIADVMGKGVTASLIGAAVKQRLNRVVTSLMISNISGKSIPTPEMIINKLHNRVAEKLISLNTFITLFYMRINIVTNQITYINAGHTKGLLITNSEIFYLTGDNLPLGVLAEEHYTSVSKTLDINDLIFIYSDGITEARNENNEEFGETRLEQYLVQYKHVNLPPHTLVQAVRKAVFEFTSHQPLSDDRTCIAVYLNNYNTNDEYHQNLQVSWNLESLTELRHVVTTMTEHAGYNEMDRNAINLAVFETATNIIRHNQKPLADAILDCHLSFEDRADASVFIL